MKKIHRFLQQETEGQEHTIREKELVHQITQVLKLRPGETIELFFDGKPARQVQLEIVSKEKISYIPLTTLPLPVTPTTTCIAAVSIIKNDHFELVVQKLSELGIKEIIPLICERTIKTTVRLDRLQKISDEAVELSGGVARVIIHEPILLVDAIKKFTDYSWVICEKGDTAISKSSESCIFAVGPEGGWTEKELALFNEKQFQFWSLAPRMLRAETAAILGAYKLLWE